jgi:hypothetical protein
VASIVWSRISSSVAKGWQETPETESHRVQPKLDEEAKPIQGYMWIAIVEIQLADARAAASFHF